MAQLLQLPQLAQHDRVANMQVGPGGIEPQLQAQRFALREPLTQLSLDDDLRDANAARRNLCQM